MYVHYMHRSPKSAHWSTALKQEAFFHLFLKASCSQPPPDVGIGTGVFISVRHFGDPVL